MKNSTCKILLLPFVIGVIPACQVDTNGPGTDAATIGDAATTGDAAAVKDMAVKCGDVPAWQGGTIIPTSLSTYVSQVDALVTNPPGKFGWAVRASKRGLGGDQFFYIGIFGDGSSHRFYGSMYVDKSMVKAGFDISCVGTQDTFCSTPRVITLADGNKRIDFDGKTGAGPIVLSVNVNGMNQQPVFELYTDCISDKKAVYSPDTNGATMSPSALPFQLQAQ